MDFSKWWQTGDHPINAYAKFSKKLTFLTPDTHTYVCDQGVRNIRFSGSFACALNG